MTHDEHLAMVAADDGMAEPMTIEETCAFIGCTERGRRQVCFVDGRYHWHGRVHYPTPDPRTRGGAWDLVCDSHLELLKVERRAAGKTTY